MLQSDTPSVTPSSSHTIAWIRFTARACELQSERHVNNIILPQDVKSGLRLQCNIAGNAGEVAISSYTVMAGWQHGSKHAEVWWQCPLSPWEHNQNKWPPFLVDVTVYDGDHEKRAQFTNYCSCQTQALYVSNIFNWKKNRTSATPCQNVEVWNMEDLITFHTSNLPFHSMLGPFHVPYRFFPSIPYHSMPWRPVPDREATVRLNIVRQP